MKPILLRLHRWTTLVFALPLAVLIATGLILSVQPMLRSAATAPGTLGLAAVEAVLAAHDPAGKARSLSYDPVVGVLAVGLPDGTARIDMATGQATTRGDTLSALFGTARRLHEHLVLDLDWLVTASTVAMLVLIALGVAMGLPRLRNTVSGWHKGTGWFLLPLVVLSPLTGLAIALNVTFAGPPPAPAGKPPVLLEAIRIAARDHDLATLDSIRQRGSRLMARFTENGEARMYLVTAGGLTPFARNWPRLLHEGNWWGIWSGLANVVTSVALAGLLGTGLFIWLRRSLRKPQRVRERSGTRATGATAA